MTQIIPAPVSFATPASTRDILRSMLPRWEPKTVPVFLADGTEAGRAVVRDDAPIPLGLVGGAYSPITHARIAEGLAPVLDVIGADASSAVFRSYRGGRQASLSITVPRYDGLQVRGDRFGRSIVVTLWYSHDTSIDVSLAVDAMRKICTNGMHALRGILPESHTKHTTNGELRFVRDAAAFAGLLSSGVDRAVRLLDAFGAYRMSPESVRAVLDQAIGVVGEPTPQQTRKIGDVVDLVQDADGRYVPASDLTALSLFEAATAYDRHRAPIRRRADTEGTDDDRRTLALVASGGGLGAKVRRILQSQILPDV